MLREHLKGYFFSARFYRWELLALLLFLFFALAFGSVRYPRETQFIFLGICAAGVIFLLGPMVGFSFYFLTTFIRGIPLPGAPVSLNQVVGVMFVLSWMNWVMRGRARLPRGKTVILMTVLFVYCLINCIISVDLEESLNYARYLCIYYFIALALASIIEGKIHCRILFWVILILSTISACLGLFELVTGIDLLTESKAMWMGRVRINGAAPNSIVFAYQLLYAFPLGYYLFSEERSFGPRFLALGLSIFITIIALFTFNRQTILLIGFTYFFCALLYRNRYSKIFLGVVLSMMLLLSPYVLHIVLRRLQTIGKFQRDISLSVRIDGIKVGLEIIKERPFTGIGLGTYHKVWDKYLPSGETRTLQYLKKTERYPDMSYNQILSEGGVIGFVLSMIYFACLFWNLWSHRKRAVELRDKGLINIYSTLFTMMCIFLLLSAIQDTFLYVRTWIMYGLILASFQSRFWEGMKSS